MLISLLLSCCVKPPVAPIANAPANGLSTKTIGNFIQHIIQLALRLTRDRAKRRIS